MATPGYDMLDMASGVQTPDVASIETGGVYYRCYVWFDTDTEAVSYALFVEQPHGQDVLLKSGIISSVSNEDIVAPVRPKICTLGTKFVAHWMDAADLNKSNLDVTTLHTASWTAPFSVTIHADGLYDVHTMRGASTYVLAFKEAVSGHLEVRRISGTDFTADWTTTVTTEIVQVCAVYGDVTDDTVIASYQRVAPSANQLWTVRMTAAAGAGASTNNTFTATEIAAANYSRVTHGRVSSTITAVIAELQPTSYTSADYSDRLRLVAYRKMANSGSGQIDNEHWCHNVHLHSRAWAYASHKTDGSDPNIYCVLGYKAVQDYNHWSQKNMFVVNLQQQDWNEDEETVRPVPLCNYNLGTADVRPGQIPSDTSGDTHVWQINNHVSSACVGPTFGPNVKGRTFAATVWTDTAAVATGNDDKPTMVIPVAARVRGYTYLPEEPWIPHRDIIDPTFPDEWNLVAYPYSAQQLEAGRALISSGGTPWVYDGQQFVELGFSWWPEILFTDNDAGAGNISLGNYYYTVVAEWRDARGQIHRSAPASPVLVAVNVDLRKVSINVRTQTLTLKHSYWYSGAPRIDFIVYRTKAGPSTTFYAIFGGSSGVTDMELSDLPVNDPTEPFVTVTDNRPDATLEDQDILPWTLDSSGNWTPLENFQPPAATAIAKWQNRVWLVSAEEDRTMWYSAEVLPDLGGVQYEIPRFHPANTYRLDEGGQIMALCPMDHGLVAFNRDRIFVISGYGNDDTGSGASFQHQIIATGIGCVEPRSVVLGTMGVFFQSEKGYYLLSRTLELDYVGADVEDDFRTAGNVRAATLHEDRHQLRVVANYSTTSADMYIYDYLFKKWAKFELPALAADERSALVDGCSWRGAAGEILDVCLANQGLLIERPDGSDAYKDTGRTGDGPIRMLVETGWIHLSGISGFKRVRKITIQIERLDAGAMEVIAYYDLDGTYELTTTETFSWASPAPDTLVLRPSYQKVNAIRLLIREKATVPQTQNIKIHAITLEVGLKKGHIRVPDSRYGTI